MSVRASSEDYGFDHTGSNRRRSKARAKGGRKERREVEPLERRLMLSTAPVVQSLLQPQNSSTLQPTSTTAYTFGGVTFNSDATTIAGLQNFLQGGSTSTSFSYTGEFDYLNQSLTGTLGLSVTTAGVSPVSVTITASHVDYSLADGNGNTIVSVPDAGGSLTLDNSGATPSLSGGVSGGFTLNVPGVSVTAATLSLDFDSSSIKLAGSISDLTVGGQQFIDPAGAGDPTPPSFDFEKSDTGTELHFAGGSLDFGGGLLNLSDIHGDLAISAAGTKGAIGATPTFTTNGISTSAQSLDLNFDTTVSPTQVTVSGQQVNVSVDGQTLTANFSVESGTGANNEHELKVGIDGLTAFFGTPDASTGVSITKGHGALLVTPEGVALDAGGTVQLQGINNLQIGGTLDLKVNTTGSEVDAQIDVPGAGTPMELKVGADQPLALEGTADLTLDDSSGNPFVTLHGGFALSKQVQTDANGTTTTLDVGAAGIDAYVGSGSENAGGVGVKISDGTLGLVVIAQTDASTKATTSSYALSASGAAALVGLDGLDVRGTLSVKANNTGQVIDQPIDVPNPNYDPTQATSPDNQPTISAEVKFDTADKVLDFGGSLSITVANALTLSGTIDITKDQTTGGADISIPSATIALDSGGTQVVSLSGSADFTIDSTDGFKLKDSKLTDFSLFGFDAGASPLASPNAALAPADAGSTSTATEGKASTTTKLGLGPLLLEGPTVGLSNFQFSGGQLQVSVDVGVDTASLRFGSGNTGGTAESSDQSGSGVSVVLTGVHGTFDLSAGFSGGTLSVAPTGAFTFGVGTLTATIPNVVTINAPSTTDTSGTDAITVNYDPADTNASDPLVTIQSADITIPKVGITGTIAPYDNNGTTIPGLVITREGLQLGQATITKTGPFTLGSVLSFQDLTVGVSDFGVNFGGGVSFNGSLSLSSSGATLFPGKPISASVSPEKDGQPALTAAFQFSNGQFSDLVFTVGKLSVTLGTYLTLSATGVTIDTGAAGDASKAVAHFDSVGAEVKAGPIDLTGSSSQFDIMGDGSFHADDNFSVTLGVGSADGSTFQWPSWLPIHIQSVGLSWPHLQSDPADFVLSLSASVDGLSGVSGLTFSGEIGNIQIDLGKLEANQFPIVGLSSFGVTVAGNLFGGQLDASLLGGILKIGQDNQILPDNAPPDQVKASVFYAGLDGGFSFDGVGGINIKLGLSQYGPLDVFLNATLPEGIVLDPDTGLAINDFTAGIAFDQTLPSLSSASDLDQLDLTGGTTETADQWLPDLQKQVVNQYVANNGSGPGLSVFTQPMEIQGSAQIFSIYTSEQAFNGQVSVAFSTDGKFAAQGKLNFGQPSPTAPPKLSVSGTLYADLSKVASGAATVLFKANAPDQVQLVTLEGSLKTGFTDDAGNPMTPGSPQTTPLNGAVVTPVTNTSFINVEYEPTLGQTLDVKSILAGGQITLSQNGNDIAVGKPVQVGPTIFEYPVLGTLTSGAASVHFIGGTWKDSAGNSGQDSTQNFQVTSLGHAFYIHVDGLALFEGADLATKLGLDPGILATNPIASISGNATLTIDTQQQLVTLDASGDMHVIGLGDVAQASAHFVIDDSVTAAPVVYGAAAFHLGSDALSQYGLTADADAVLEINTGTVSHSVVLSGVTSNGVKDPTFTLDPGTAQVQATALISVNVGSGANQVFRVDGNLLLKVNADGMDLFASGEVQIGPSSKPLFDVNGAAVFVLRDGSQGETPGIAGQIYLNRSGSLPFDVVGVSFSGSAFAQFNTTEAPQGFELPASFDSRLPDGFKSLLIPIVDQGQPRYQTNITAGPPNADGTSGTPQVYLTTALSGDLVIQDVLTLSGQVQITVDANEFVIDGVVHYTRLGLGTLTGTISFNATADGMWGAAELDLQSQSLPDASMSGHFVLSVNTTSGKQDVPQYTINDQTGAITKTGTTLSLAAGTLNLGFGGTVTFGGVFAASGDFEFTVSASQLTATANAEMSLGPIGSMHLTGDLQINSAGLVVYGTLGFDAGQTSVGSAYGLGITGSFTFGVNSTSSQVTLDNHPVDPGVKVSVTGSADFLGFASGSGTITLAALSNQLNLSFDVDFSLASVLNLHADGAATIYTDGRDGIAVDLNVTSSAGLPVANVFTLNFSAGGTVQINTTTAPRYVNGVWISAKSFTADMSGSVNLLNVITLSGGLDVTVQNGQWMVQVPQSNQLSLNFFNIASVHAWGFFNSQGAFNIDVNGSLQLGDSSFGVSGGGDIHVYNNSDTTGSLSDTRGALNINGSVHMTGTLFGVYVDTGVNFNYDGSDGRIYTDIDVSVGIHIHIHTIFGDINYDGGFSVYTAHFTIGYLVQPPPVQLGQVDANGALHLYVGSLAANRMFDVNQADESVDLSGSGYDGSSQTITVQMLGQQQTFTGVKSIVGNFGDGSDYVGVGSSVAVPVSFDMGTGNNTAVDNGSGAATLSASGGGYDTLQGGTGPDTVTAGSGHYQISGGGNGDRITLDPTGTSGSVYAISESNDLAPNYLTVDGTSGATQYRLDVDANNGVNGGSITVGDPNALDSGNNHTADVIGFGGLQGVTLGATGSGNTFNVRGTVIPTTVNAGSGSATINVGSQAPGTGGTLSSIGSPLTLNGSGATTLSLDDSGDTIGRTGQLNATSVTGLGASAAVNFTGLSDLTALNLALGSGGNAFTVNATPAPLTLSTGAGNDTVNVNAVSQPTTLNGQGGTDTINVRAAGALTTINTGAGSHTTVNLGSAAPNSGGKLGSLLGEVVVNGSGNDALNLDDTGDSAARTATISSDTVNGLGMTAGVVYDGLAALRLSLGSGANTVGVATNGNQTATTVNGGAGNDQFNVLSTGAVTTINTGGGANTTNVGSTAPATGGTLSGVQGELVVNGTPADTLNVDDTGDIQARSATITSDQVTGLGMGQGGIVYNGIGTLNVSLGSGGNTVLLANAGSNASTTLNAGSGNDVVTVANDGGTNVINGQGGNDTVNVRTTGGTTTVNAGAGTNTVNVGSLAPAVGGVVNGIQGELIVNGSPADTMNVDDTGDASAQFVAISSNQITGLGMGQNGIVFEQLGTLNVSLGSGGNAVLVSDAGNNTVTTVNTGAGNDHVTVANDSSPNTINTQAGTDQVDILTTGGATTVNTGAGADTINVGNATGAIQGAVTIVGNGADTLNVSDTADAQPAVGTLTPTTLTGLGMTPAGITYSGLANLNIALGSGGNTLTVNDIDPATHTTADGGSSTNDTVTANFAADFNGRLDLTAFEHGSVAVAGNFNGTLNDTAPGHLESVQVGGSLTAPAALTAGSIDKMTVGGNLAGNVNVAGTLAQAQVGGDVSGNVTETGMINQFTVGGSVTATATITASNPVPDDANLYSLQVGGDMDGKITVSGTLSNATVGGDVSGSVTESGTINQFTIGGSLTPTGLIKAVNATPSLGNINSLTIGQDLAGTVIVSGTLGTLTIVNGSFAPTANVTVGTLNTFDIGPDHLNVGQNLAGNLTVTGTLGSVRVAGGTPGLITAGHVGTIAVYGGFGPDVARVIENGIQRRIELATPTNPYPLPDPTVTVTGPYVNVQYFYESGALANPQLTARITNNVSTARDQYDLSLVTYNDVAKFNLARLDASGVAGVRNVDVEGDLLNAVTPQAAGFFKLANGVIDPTPAGVRLPQDNLAGVGIRDFAPDGEIQARSIQAVAFGSHAEGGWTEPGASANANDAAELLSPGTAIVQANDTFRVPFADQPQYHVGLFVATDEHGGHFDNDSINLAVEGVASPNATGTGNVITPSNVARGADTALITVVPTYDRLGRIEDSVVQSIAIRGDGASIQTGQYITAGITSTGPLGDLTLSSGQGISNVTAPSIFGSITTNGPITGTVQTTGVRTDPITSATSNVPADLGGVYMVPSGRSSWAVTSTVIQSKGGLPGQIISRGNLISAITSDGGISGTIAAQGNLGTYATVAGNTTRLGGVLSNGTFAGELIVLGDAIGDVTLHGGLHGGNVAVKGSILGNLLVNGGLDAGSAIVAGGAIGSPLLGTALTVQGRNAGIIAAKATVRFAGGSPGGAVFNNAATGPNAAAIDALFTNAGQPLALDLNAGDLQGLTLIQQDLLRLHVAPNGTLAGPVA